MFSGTDRPPGHLAVPFTCLPPVSIMDFNRLLSFVLLVPLVVAQKPCVSLTKCAVEKCLDRDQLHRIIKNSTRENLFGNVVERFDLVCIAAKCNKECQGCSACHYALEQMSALAQGEPTSGLCPKLENCVLNCLVGDLPKVLACVASRCNVHCYDGDCPSCKTMSKRMFSLICAETGMTGMSHVRYPGNCPSFFNELSEDYVAKRKRALNLQ